jgi:hypothetical protein
MILGWCLVGFAFLAAIIYYTVKAAVKEGTFEALVEYDEYKNQKQSDKG